MKSDTDQMSLEKCHWKNITGIMSLENVIGNYVTRKNVPQQCLKDKMSHKEIVARIKYHRKIVTQGNVTQRKCRKEKMSNGQYVKYVKFISKLVNMPVNDHSCI